jgi:aminoglycoside phosphotransferase (APT) family kinase protein
VPTPARQLCVLLHEGHVLTDAERRVPSYDEDHRHTPLTKRAAACGDPTAVLVAPQLQVHEDPMVLLSVFSSRGERVAGTWTAIDDLAEDPETVAALRSVTAVADGSTAPPPRRPDWYRLTWYDEVESWVDARLAEQGRRRTGPVEPTNVWMVSAVMRVPCAPGPPVWLKAACPHFHAEPALTRVVSQMDDEHAPTIVAVDEARAWLLVEEIAGAEEDDEPTPPGMGTAAARLAATLHLRSLDHLAEIEAAGVPVRDLSTTLRQFDEILLTGVELDQLTPDELAAARATRSDVHAALEELAGLGIPDTLVHGDLHIGNVAQDGDSLVIFDWSDAAVSHPFLDQVLLCERLPDDQQEGARAAYAEVWRAARPGVDVDRALELAVPANTIYQMVTFEQLYRAGEAASYWEMSGVVARFLRRLPDSFPKRP